MSGPEHTFSEFVVNVLENLCGFQVYVTSQPRAFLGTGPVQRGRCTYKYGSHIQMGVHGV